MTHGWHEVGGTLDVLLIHAENINLIVEEMNVPSPLCHFTELSASQLSDANR